MLFRTHEKNIPQIKACVDAFGDVWVHGSGDIYPVFKFDPENPTEQDASHIQANNHNKGFEHLAYRVQINKNNMPKSKEELDRMLRQAHDHEEIIRRGAKHEATKVKSVVMPVEDFVDPDAEIDYSSLTQFNRSQQTENEPKKGKKSLTE